MDYNETKDTRITQAMKRPIIFGDQITRRLKEY